MNMMKNKLKIYKQDGYWACETDCAIGVGYTPAIAYNNWARFRK